jgi:glycosyltransferase EpsD
MSKKVLFISNHAGFSKFNAPYMLALHDEGYVVHNASPGIETGFYDQHFDVPITRNPLSFNNVKSLWELVKICRKEKYDLIHCHTPVGGVIGRLLKLVTKNTKIIYTAHGFHFYKGSSVYMWLVFFPVEFFLSFMTDSIITINEEDHQYALKYLKCKSVLKLNGVGVNVDRFYFDEAVRKELRQKLEFKSEDFVLIYAAQFINRKNHRFILKALSKYIERTGVELKLLLVGSGPLLESMKSLSSDIGLANNVVFTGYVSNIEDYYSSADALVSCSNQEGFGLNLVEGLAAGLPYLASDVRGHRDIHLQTPDNLLYKLGDEEHFVSQLSLLVEKVLSSKLALSNSCALSANKFQVKYSVNAMLPIYSKYLK